MIRAIITYQRFAFTAVVQRSSLSFPSPGSQFTFRVARIDSSLERGKFTTRSSRAELINRIDLQPAKPQTRNFRLSSRAARLKEQTSRRHDRLACTRLQF